MKPLQRRNVVILATSLAVMAVTMGVTTSNLARSFPAQTALRLIPCNATAKGDAARQMVYTPLVNTAPSKATIERAQDLAREAVRCEPLAPRAFNALALTAYAKNDTAAAKRYLDQAERLSRRDLLNNLLLIEEAVSEQDVDKALHRYDVALRVSSEAGPVLFPTLATVSVDPELAAPVLRLLRQQPPWLERFLFAAADNDAALPGLPRLLSQLDGKIVVTDDLKFKVMGRLIERGFFPSAETYYRAQRHLGAAPLATVRDWDFKRGDGIAPFEWELPAAGSAGTIIDPREGLMINTSGPSGTQARQLIKLSPGNYRLSTSYRISGDETAYLSWLLQCAGKDGAAIASIPLPPATDTKTVAQTFTVPAGCAYQWLQLDFESQNDRFFTGAVRSVDIRAQR